MSRALIILIAGWIVGSLLVRADADAPQATLPTLPAEYSQYMVGSDTISPDGQYGVMYLKHDAYSDDTHYGSAIQCLVSPFLKFT